MESIVKISFIILTYKRLNLLTKCIDSIFNQSENYFDIEVLILINGEDIEALQYLEDKANLLPAIKFYTQNKPLYVGAARDKLIEKSCGDYLCFIDDDTTLPINYLKTAEQFIQDYPDADVFGGPDQTSNDANHFQQVLGAVMETFMAMGPTAKRHNGQKKKYILEGSEMNLILCNLWIKKSILKEKNFPSQYIRNEENILLARLKSESRVLYYLPFLTVFHERKNSFLKIIKATYFSGMYRAIGFFDEFKTFNFYFLVPLLFIITLLYTLVFDQKIFIYLFTIYVLTVVANAFIVSHRINLLYKIPLAVIFYLIYNFIYPVGMIVGFLKKIGRKDEV